MTESNMEGAPKIKAPDWSDFGDMSSVLPHSSDADVNPLGVNVKLEQMDEYREFYEPQFEKALEDSPNGKVYGVNNSIMAVLERPAGSDGGQKLKLVPLSPLNRYQLNRLEQGMRDAGFVSAGLTVPHSSDGGQWIDQCMKFGESQDDYSKRLKKLGSRYGTLR